MPFEYIEDDANETFGSVSLENYDADDVMSDARGSNNNTLNIMKTIGKSALKAFNDPVGEPKRKAEQFNTVATESTKLFVKTATGLTSSIGDLSQFMGDNLMINDIEEKAISFAGLIGKDDELGKKLAIPLHYKNKLGENVKKFGKGLSDLMDTDNMEWLDADLEVFSGSFKENPSWERALSVSIGSLPSLAASAGLYGLFGRATALIGLGALEAAPAYTEAKAAGKSQDESNLVLAANTTGLALLEQFSAIGGGYLDKPIKNMTGRITNTILGASAEGITEGLQEIWQNLVAKVGYDETRGLFDNVIESFIAGGFTGGALSSISPSVAQAQKETKKRLMKKGVPEAVIDAFVDETAVSMANNAEDVDKIISEDLEAGFKSLEELQNDPDFQEEMFNARDFAEKKAKAAGRTDAEAKIFGSMYQKPGQMAAKLGLSAKEWFDANRIDIQEGVSEPAVNAEGDLVDADGKVLFQTLSNVDVKNVEGGFEFTVNDKDGEVGLLTLKQGDMNSLTSDVANNLDDGFIELDWVKVNENKRGVGIGSALMNEAISYADNNGKQVYLNAAGGFGDISVNKLSDFYSKYGFKEVKTGDNSIEMVREPQDANIYNQFAGKRALTANINKRNAAIYLEGQGKSKEEILRKTNWFRGTEGEWRFEISDDNSSIIDIKEGSNKLPDVMEHEELFAAYPELADIEVVYEDFTQYKGKEGFTKDPIGFVDFDGSLHINSKITDKERIRDIILHEVQHVIQVKEGFDEGGLSRGLPGEQEASLVVERKDLTKDQRTSISEKILLQESAKRQGSFVPRKNLIKLFETANETTLMHEGAHFVGTQIVKLNKISQEKFQKNMPEYDALVDWLGEPVDGEFSLSQEEKFARGFESFIREGKVANNKLKAVFIRMAEWFRNIYKTTDDIRYKDESGKMVPVKLSDGARQLYNDILDSPYVDEQTFYQELLTESSAVAEKIRTGDIRDLTKDDIEKLTSIIGSNTRRPAAPTDFLTAVRKAGGLKLSTAQSVDIDKALKDTVAYKGVLTKDGFIEDTLTELVEEFTGKAVDSVEAFDFLREAIDTPTFRAEDQETIDTIEAIDKNLDYIEQTIGGDVKFLRDRLKSATKLQKVGFTETASKELVIAQMAIEKLRMEGANIGSLTRAEIKNLQTEITNVIKDLPISPAGKSKFLSTIKNVNTPIQFRNAYNNVLRRAEAQIKQELTNKYETAIAKELKASKDKTVSGRKVGKYDYTTNKIFKDLREYNKLNKMAAFEKLETLRRSPSIDYADDIRTRFLSMKMLGKSNGSAELFAKVYQDLLDIKDAGKGAKGLKEFETKLQDVSNIEFAREKVAEVKKGKVAKGKGKLIQAMGDWDTFLNVLGGKAMQEKFGLVKAQNKEAISSFHQMKSRLNTFAENYGVEEDSIPMAIKDMQKPLYEVFGEGAVESDTLTKMDIIAIYAITQNKNSLAEYEDYLGAAQLNQLFQDNLQQKDKDYAMALIDYLAEYHGRLNAVNVELSGVDLGTVENYFPTKKQYDSYEDRMADYIQQSTVAGAMKSRTEGKKIPDLHIDAWAAVQRYSAEAEHMINVAIPLREVNRTFADANLKTLIRNRFGEDLVRNIDQKITEDYGLHGINKRIDITNKWIDKVLGNWTAAKTGASISIFEKQLISNINFMDDMKTKDFNKYFMEGIANPKKTLKFMMDNSELIPVRLQKGGADHMQRMISDAQNNINVVDEFMSEKLKFNEIKFKRMQSVLQRTGDIAPFVYGGYARVRYNMEVNNMSLKDAMEEMEIKGLNTQQSGLSSQLSDWQNSSSGFKKAMFLFKNTISQYSREILKAAEQRSRGEITSAVFKKKILIYGLINPTIFGIISVTNKATPVGTLGFLALLATGGFDDEDEFLPEIIASIASQPGNSLPWFNMLNQPIIDAIIKGRGWRESIPVIKDINDALLNYQGEWEPSALEIMEVLSEVTIGAAAKKVHRDIKKGEEIFN